MTGNSDLRSVRLRVGAWYQEESFELELPPGWQAQRLEPRDAPALDDAAIERALATGCGSAPLRELARGRRSAVLAVDDLTRPTPVHRFLPRLLAELEAGGLGADAIRIVMGTAAHRPMEPDEIARKLGPEVAARFTPVVHDFRGPDVRFVDWVDGGPVHLSRHLLEADLKICIGGVIPHNETGFGGGAKMVVPGLAGAATIAHFHGALPPRPAGRLEPDAPRRDRRAWAETVARHVGVDAVVCANVNASGELAGLVCGDVVEAHREAARAAREIGRTRVPASAFDAVLVNAYPLDTDPIQMGKSITIAQKLDAPVTVAVNAASDGVFYHGMGMGSGFHLPRVLRNVPRFLTDPKAQWRWLRGLAAAFPSPLLAARLSYFTLNDLSWAEFEAGDARRSDPPTAAPRESLASPLLLSTRFPAWGFRRRYPRGSLYRDWPALRDRLARWRPAARVAVFPCAPLQLPETD